MQDKLETILDIVTIDDDDSQIMNTDSEMVNKVLAQDLNSHEYVHLSQDEETVDLQCCQ